MSETGYCFFSTMMCKGEQCDLYHETTGLCKIVMLVNRLLGDIDGPVKATPPKEVVDPQSTGGVIQRILSMRPNLTKEAVERLVDEERAKAAGLLTEQAAAHLVAANLGLDGRTPLASAMKVQPDMSQIEWLIKGNKEARDTDPFAYAFVFKYDAAAKAATDELRPEATELYNYLRANNNALRIGEFVYSLNKTETLFARNKART